MVLPNGTILNTMETALRKDNTGYDLNQLFIGSEGTLGFISGVSILCPNKPKSTNVILISVNGDSFKNVIDIFKVAKLELNEILSAFEFWDKESMISLSQNLSLENPFSSINKSMSDECQFYCLAETHGSCEKHDVEKIEHFYSRLMSAKLCQNAIIADSKAQFSYLWSLRERLPESIAKDGYNYKYDISLPLAQMYNLVHDMRKKLSGSGYKRCVAWGHLGLQNIYYIILVFKLYRNFAFWGPGFICDDSHLNFNQELIFNCAKLKSTFNPGSQKSK